MIKIANCFNNLLVFYLGKTDIIFMQQTDGVGPGWVPLDAVCAVVVVKQRPEGSHHWSGHGSNQGAEHAPLGGRDQEQREHGVAHDGRAESHQLDQAVLTLWFIAGSRGRGRERGEGVILETLAVLRFIRKEYQIRIVRR